MHTNPDVNAKPRGPPARSRAMCPLSTCCHTGWPVASANLRGQTPCPETNPHRRGPCCDGLTRERSQVGPLSMSAAPAKLSTPNL